MIAFDFVVVDFLDVDSRLRRNVAAAATVRFADSTLYV